MTPDSQAFGPSGKAVRGPGSGAGGAQQGGSPWVQHAGVAAGPSHTGKNVSDLRSVVGRRALCGGHCVWALPDQPLQGMRS